MQASVERAESLGYIFVCIYDAMTSSFVVTLSEYLNTEKELQQQETHTSPEICIATNLTGLYARPR